MLGFGLSPAGTGAFGLGTPEIIPEQGTGTVGSRWINPATKTYEVNEYTHNLKQMPGVRQMVLLAVMTLQGSASPNPRFGVKPPTKMGNTFEAECKDSVKKALSHMTDSDSPLIRVDKITVTRGRNSRAEVLIDYVDISTGETDSVSSPL